MSSTLSTLTFEQHLLAGAPAAASYQHEEAVSARAAYQDLLWAGAVLVGLDGPVPLGRGRFLVIAESAADDDRARSLVRGWRARGVDAAYVLGGRDAWAAAGLPAR